MKSIVRDLIRVSRSIIGYRGISEFFTPEEIALPAKARQKYNTMDELFDQAEETCEYMLDWLNRGRGIDKKLGLRRIDLTPSDMPNFFEDFDRDGSVLVIVPQKKEDRATEKVDADYDGDWSRLVDIVRATIAVEEYSELQSVVDALRESGMVLARRPEDSFVTPSVCGCRRLKVNMVYPNGHIGEIQIHLKGIFRISVCDHELYEKVREIESNAKKQDRDWLTKEEIAVVVGLNRVIADRYEQAWKQYAPTTASKPVMAFMGDEVTYYEYGGYPVESASGCFPVLWLKNRKIVVYDLLRFMNKAHQISRQEFDEMVEELKS